MIFLPEEVGGPIYGGWLKTSGNDGALTASAFYGERVRGSSGVSRANPFRTLRGQATYEDGAASLYTLHRPVGARNEAGPFAADTMVEANFDSLTIKGIPSHFRTGALGERRKVSGMSGR